EPRNLMLRGFAPRVGVVASGDTEEIVREKGVQGGFLALVRPFGEWVQGKVTVRDSHGASRTWEDYGVRFVGMGDEADVGGLRVGGDIGAIEEAVDRHLEYAEVRGELGEDDLDGDDGQWGGEPGSSTALASAATSLSSSPFYSLYIRRLLSGLPLTSHETFAHPVACIIAISSRNPAPIEELRNLYSSTNAGIHRLPPWVNNDYLRYYVLVHDEDHDDITKSTSLYEQMKRHFGLHCHLLRLRSTQCVPSDDDSVRLPLCEWISAGEELSEIERRESADDDEDPTPCVFDSDATALRTFVRELVTQSVIPSMERLSATWNEQVLSRRRGLSGRFMSLSKRWTPFGGSNPLAAAGGGSGGPGGHYDSQHGVYRPDAPEAVMRKLADYAFMLRDFRLAHSTYEVLRGDFGNDKAWRHYAGAAEMCALTSLLLLLPPYAAARLDQAEQNLDNAAYSYVTRCAAPYHALRALTCGLELLRLRATLLNSAPPLAPPPGAGPCARWSSASWGPWARRCSRSASRRASRRRRGRRGCWGRGPRARTGPAAAAARPACGRCWRPSAGWGWGARPAPPSAWPRPAGCS
ncbi:ER-golgi trafficking TRAPP I complex 85 kDa subunit-domain-containing protein, partial [Lineolata rhizophorae]